MNQNTPKVVEEFGRIIREREIFLYIPLSAIDGLNARKLDAVEFPGLPPLHYHEQWKEYPRLVRGIVAEFEKICKYGVTLPRADINDPEQWREILRYFLFEEDSVYTHLSDGTILELLFSEVVLGTSHAPGGSYSFEPHHDRGCLVALKNKFSKTRVTRLMRLVREHLHKVRRESPVKIIDFAKQLDLLGL